MTPETCDLRPSCELTAHERNDPTLLPITYGLVLSCDDAERTPWEAWRDIARGRILAVAAAMRSECVFVGPPRSSSTTSPNGCTIPMSASVQTPATRDAISPRFPSGPTAYPQSAPSNGASPPAALPNSSTACESTPLKTPRSSWRYPRTPSKPSSPPAQYSADSPASTDSTSPHPGPAPRQ